MSKYRQEVDKITEVIQRIACSYEGCPDPAIFKDKNCAPICRRHWDMVFNKQVQEGLKKLGLVTRDEKIEFCRRKAVELKRNMAREGSKDWAKNILQNFEDGDYYDIGPIEMARKALRLE